MVKVEVNRKLVEELRWRGMIHDIMPGTEELLGKEQVTAYVGIDPTADSLHIGHLVGVMMLKDRRRAAKVGCGGRVHDGGHARDVSEALRRGGDPVTVKRKTAKVGRNDPCPCGSGKKFKKCLTQNTL